MLTIILARHGHVQGIEPERFRGQADIPLTDQGVAEAAALARRVAVHWHPTVIYSSPLSRCMATANAIADACAAKAVALSALEDIDYGAWQWRSHDEIREQYPSLYATWFATPQLMRFPGGESLQDLISRAADALRLVLESHPSGTVVMVGHESVNRALLLQFLDMPLSAYWRICQSPCAVNEIGVDAGNFRVLRMNDTSHLTQSGAG